jgi:hypothetical protein
LSERKRFDYRHVLCLGVTLGCLAFSVFTFSGSLGRIVESGRDVGISLAYYFTKMLGWDIITPTVTQLPRVPFFDFLAPAPAPTTPLPDTVEGFTSDWARYWAQWATRDNLAG